MWQWVSVVSTAMCSELQAGGQAGRQGRCRYGVGWVGRQQVVGRWCVGMSAGRWHGRAGGGWEVGVQAGR